LDVSVTVVTGIAAVFVVARLSGWSGLGNRGEPSGPPKVEDVASLGLSTSSTGVSTVGSPDARVILLEFSDFECPFCARYAEETFASLEQDFVKTGQIQYLVRQFPLEQIHRFAVPAARAAYCAEHQTQFWEMRRVLFSMSTQLANANWSGLAADLQLDTEKFNECVADDDVLARIQEDRREGSRLGVEATPTFFIGRNDGQGRIQIASRIRGAAPAEVFREGLTKLLGAGKQT